MIEFRNVSKIFNGRYAIQDINLTLDKHLTYVLLGTSGAGKTTLIRLMNGLHLQDEGDILIDNIKLCKKNLTKIRKTVGFVFQNFNLFPHFTALKNIIFTPKNILKNNTYEEILTKANLILQKLDIYDQRHKYPSQLSGGQRQRLALARSLILDPKIMILDEPTSSLDPANTNQIINEIQMMKRQNITTIVVTHDIILAKKVADRILFLKQGKLIANTLNKDFFDIVNHTENDSNYNLDIKDFLKHSLIKYDQ